MALNGQKTSNFELYKPSLQDSPPDITSTNENWDKIDTELKRLGDVGLPANINKKLPTAITTMEVMDVYVSPTGNDTATGTSTAPLKNISTVIARFGGVRRLVIHLNAGTYTETNAIEVSGCTSVEMVVVSGTAIVTTPYVQYGGYFTANGVSFHSSTTETRDALTFNGVSVNIDGCSFINKNTAVVFRNGSVGLVVNSTFTNCGRAIWSLNGSFVSAQNISGLGNTEAYRTTSGAITVGTSTIEATTLAAKYGGGVIFRNGNLIGTTANTFVNAT